MKGRLLSEPAFLSRSVVAEVRDQTSNDDHEWYDPTYYLSEIDPINPRLEPDFQINGEDGFLDWRLNHFGLPFARN